MKDCPFQHFNAMTSFSMFEIDFRFNVDFKFCNYNSIIKELFIGCNQDQTYLNQQFVLNKNFQFIFTRLNQMVKSRE